MKISGYIPCLYEPDCPYIALKMADNMGEASLGTPVALRKAKITLNSEDYDVISSHIADKEAAKEVLPSTDYYHFKMDSRY